MIFITASAILGIVLGAALLGWISRVRAEALVRSAKDEAAHMINEAKSLAEDLMEEAKERVGDAEDKLWEQNQKEILSLQKRVQTQEDSYRQKRSHGDRTYNQEQRDIQKQINEIKRRDQIVEERQDKLNEIKARGADIKKQLVSRLEVVAQASATELKEKLLIEAENQMHVEAKKKANAYEEDVRLNSETMAKRILASAINRFPRESCTERGIGVVEVVDEAVKNRLFSGEQVCIRKLEEICGVDVSLGDNGNVTVSGFDPVRRELTTRALEKLIAEKNPTPQIVERIVEKSKRDLFQKIDHDGRKIASEMGMHDFHPEIKNMLGSLRYRYSFAQNQFFHVGEVGWLCGLLASELSGVDQHSAKRSGVLHDIGKAMDHSIDGGHAVIGADFIKKWGEKEHVVHAVRAHHYEEQPSTDLAYLVIAADAISGARPGARRSTVNNYNQKIEALSTIGDGFPGVNRTLVFNAGREVRILVDGAKVNDEQSLRLCSDIAKKIEVECTYPGQIKVVVVRETHAQAVAK